MEYQDIQADVKACVKGKVIKYSLILFLTSLLGVVLGLLSPLLIMMTQSYSGLLILSIVIMVLIVVMQNTVYYMFLKVMRNEKFRKADIRYSISKTALHMLMFFLLLFLQAGIDGVLRTVLGSIPYIYNIVSMVVNIFVTSITIFCAFAILDGVHGAMNILNGSIKLMTRFWKLVFMLAMPYFIWIMLCQIGGNLLFVSMLGNSTTLEDILRQIVENPAIINVLLIQIGILIIQSIGSSYFLVYLVSSYASIFDHEYSSTYSIDHHRIRSNVIDIDNV